MTNIVCYWFCFVLFCCHTQGMEIPRPGNEAAPQPLQWLQRILNLLHHKGAPNRRDFCPLHSVISLRFFLMPLDRWWGSDELFLIHPYSEGITSEVSAFCRSKAWIFHSTLPQVGCWVWIPYLAPQQTVKMEEQAPLVWQMPSLQMKESTFASSAFCLHLVCNC